MRVGNACSGIQIAKRSLISLVQIWRVISDLRVDILSDFQHDLVQHLVTALSANSWVAHMRLFEP